MWKISNMTYRSALDEVRQRFGEPWSPEFLELPPEPKFPDLGLCSTDPSWRPLLEAVAAAHRRRLTAWQERERLWLMVQRCLRRKDESLASEVLGELTAEN